MPLSSSGEFDDVLQDSYVTGVVTVGTTQVEAKVGSTTSISRELLYIENKSNNAIYYGPTGVTTSTGAVLEKKQFVFLPVGEAVKVYLIAGSAGNDVVVQELG